jgi:electron transfer flavoprotein beta subunit
LERGIESVEAKLPVGVTINGSAPPCRPRNAKLIQKYKHAKTVTEKQEASTDYIELFSLRPYLNLQEWGVADVDADVRLCGLAGSPTKVKKIENVDFQAKESKTIEPTDTGIEELMKELIANHTI